MYDMLRVVRTGTVRYGRLHPKTQCFKVRVEGTTKFVRAEEGRAVGRPPKVMQTQWHSLLAYCFDNTNRMNIRVKVIPPNLPRELPASLPARL